ncbi:uncharacterized protein LOC112561983 [Pomacea canaliculata]|nr:uncharacterized protein LOC112561983 [Pomacea canaliculata]
MNMPRNALSWMVVVMCVLCLMASVFIYVQHYILSTPTKHHFPRDTVPKCTSPADLKVSKASTPSMLRSGREDNATATTVDCSPHMVTNGSYSQPQQPQHTQVAPHKFIHETFRKIKSSGGRFRVGRADKPGDDGWFWSLLTSPPPTDVPRVSPSMLKARGQKVILLTYVRSGSSLTADIIDHSSDVYYVFEPLYKLADYAKHVKNW